MIVEFNELNNISQQLQSTKENYQTINICSIYIPNAQSCLINNDNEITNEFINELEQLDDVVRIHSNLS